MQVDHEWEERRPGLSSLCNNCHTRLPRVVAQPSHSNRLNWRVAVSPVWLQATERKKWCSNCCFYFKCTTAVRNCVCCDFWKSHHLHVVLQLRVTLSPVIQMSRGQRRRGVVFQRDSQPATRHTISVSREEGRRDLSIELYTFLTDGKVTERGCSTTDRICQGEYSVQSRHIRE